MSSNLHLVPAHLAVDHLLLGVRDLSEGVAWVESVTGVKASPGGSHPGVGTRNALFALGGQRYLEIIAPDPEQTSYSFPIDIRQLTEPRLSTWAVSTPSIQEMAERAKQAGYRIYGPQEGSRSRPDGRVLKWRLVRLENSFGDGRVEPLPFFIEWADDSVHPSEDSPGGCEIVSLEFRHPDPDSLSGALNRLGIQANVKHGPQIRVITALTTPKGDVELT